MKESKLSIIIPVLNEASTLPLTLSSFKTGENEEIIIIDGGSTDNTVEVARRHADKVLITKKGRGTQLRNGAELATGDLLFFLHADCIPPDNAFRLIRSTLSDIKVSAGCFDLAIDSLNPLYRLIECGANLRSHITGIPYGDQGLFIKKEVYEKIGGFSEMTIMEDIEIAQRLKKHGKIVFVNKKIKASPRRWEKEGILYTTIRDWIIALLFSIFRAPPDKLLKYYKNIR